MEFVVRLGLLYTGVFGAIGVQLPFLPVWLAAKGLDEQAIGAVLATAIAARVIVSMFADTIGCFSVMCSENRADRSIDFGSRRSSTATRWVTKRA